MMSLSLGHVFDRVKVLAKVDQCLPGLKADIHTLLSLVRGLAQTTKHHAAARVLSPEARVERDLAVVRVGNKARPRLPMEQGGLVIRHAARGRGRGRWSGGGRGRRGSPRHAKSWGD